MLEVAATEALNMIASGIVGSSANGLLGDALKQFRWRWQQYRAAGQLPQHKHIERGTIRACLMATQISIQRMIDAGAESQLDDTLHVEDRGLSLAIGRTLIPPANTIARSALRKKLNELISTLECAETRPKPAKASHLDTAITEGSLELSSLALDKMGIDLLVTTNESNLNASPQIPKQAIAHTQLTEARERLLPDLDDAVVTQVLRFGNWSGRTRRMEVATAIRAAFFGEDELWLTAFSMCYAAEITADSNLYKLAVMLRLERLEDALEAIPASNRAIERAIDDLKGNISKTFGEIGEKALNAAKISAQAALAAEEVLTLVRKRFSIQEKLVFFKPSIASAAHFDSSFRPFYFAEEEDDFIGRETVLAELREKLLRIDNESPQFLWSAICGDAGTGKSRLAHHILKTESARWRLSGFVRSDFIQAAKLMLTDLSAISGPTLFVIDYAGSAPEACCHFLKRCALLAEEAPYPVRALVLLRRSNDRFFGEVKRGEDGAAVPNSQLAFLPPKDLQNDKSGALFLTGLTERETATLMRERINRTRKPTDDAASTNPPDLTDNELLSILRRYDISLRPLFSVMVADAVARGMLPCETHADTTLEEARLTLFWDYLEHQYNKRWRSLISHEETVTNREQIDRHLTFLILSTMCRGLTKSGWHALHTDLSLGQSTKATLPKHPDDFTGITDNQAARVLDEKHLLAGLSGAMPCSGEDEPYPILEPDLVGESLVLLAFDRRGESLCGQAVTDDYRRRFLRDYAWCADPQGAAFFSVLTAQDFPDRSAKLNWLLPKEPRPDSVLERAKLFRSLALTSVSPLSTRAATRIDIERMRELIEQFPVNDFDNEEAQHERSSGIEILAEQLSFVINKGIAPTSATKEAPIPDKLGRRLLTFGRAANSTDPISNIGNVATDRQAVFRFTSDNDTVSAAIALLRQLYNDAVEPALSDSNSFELRRLHAAIIHHALTSVFWEYRNDQSKYGFASTGLSAEERETRALLAERCDTNLATDRLNEYSIAILAKIMRSLMFAEYGAVPSRGQGTFMAIQSLCNANGFSNATAISETLGMLDNYGFLQVSRLQNTPQEELDTTPRSAIISDVATKLLDAASTIDTIDDLVRKRIVDSWCAVAVRLGDIERLQGASPLPCLSKFESSYLDFLDRRGDTPISSNVINFYSHLIRAHRHEESPPDKLIKSYSQIVQRCGFDPITTNHQSWKNLGYHYWQLRGSDDTSWIDARPIFEAAAHQIGDRAQRDLTDMLIDTLPDPAARIERDIWLINLIQQNDQTKPQSENRLKLKIALIAQHLISGNDNAALSDLEAMWSTDITEDDFIQRTAVLIMLKIFLYWYGPENPRLTPWRQRLLTLTSPPSTLSADSPARKMHNLAVVEAAASFARLEIASGGSPDEWLTRSATS